MEKKSYKYISEVFKHDSLKNKRCFLLGGGPSLKHFDYSILKNEFTIGINKTFTVFSPTINYSSDLKFYNFVAKFGDQVGQTTIHNKWLDYTGYKTILCPNRSENRSENINEDTYVVKQLSSKLLSLDVEQGIYPARNSGFAGLMLAISLGCKEIYLLGYDLNCEQTKTHWHEGYPNFKAVENYSKILKKFIKSFEDFKDIIEENGIKVVNLNLSSALTCFEKRNLNTVLTGI